MVKRRLTIKVERAILKSPVDEENSATIQTVKVFDPTLSFFDTCPSYHTKREQTLSHDSISE
jgi:hypothetical protein